MFELFLGEHGVADSICFYPYKGLPITQNPSPGVYSATTAYDKALNALTQNSSPGVYSATMAYGKRPGYHLELDLSDVLTVHRQKCTYDDVSYLQSEKK
uniref:Uncharacterized protein n=1 Tax=Glossina pallidipes TaxID=7398 RepID=A0A1B0A3P7_GLOPL